MNHPPFLLFIPSSQQPSSSQFQLVKLNSKITCLWKSLHNIELGFTNSKDHFVEVFFLLALLRRTSFLTPSMVYISVINTHITNYNLSPINSTMPQAGICLPAQSHASYEASALPPSHHGWIYFVEEWLSNNSPKIGLIQINVHDYANGRN